MSHPGPALLIAVLLAACGGAPNEALLPHDGTLDPDEEVRLIEAIREDSTLTARGSVSIYRGRVHPVLDFPWVGS